MIPWRKLLPMLRIRPGPSAPQRVQALRLVRPDRSTECFMQMTDWEIDQFYEQKCCPDCGGHDFVKGPSGGMTTNTACINCGTEWNLSWDLPFGQRSTVRGWPEIGRLATVFGFTSEMTRDAGARSVELRGQP